MGWTSKTVEIGEEEIYFVRLNNASHIKIHRHDFVLKNFQKIPILVCQIWVKNQKKSSSGAKKAQKKHFECSKYNFAWKCHFEKKSH